ncbi:hypothetical protein BPOR_0097g00100 [Botrytis porri]|uniref:Bystin n=1 Tax=Botrytis porri TaxID=87229 RepID=A0A4Z1KZ07_9HELO|nr:hypothetical protein BPOR_0097g00100 [Botrytis porri]
MPKAMSPKELARNGRRHNPLEADLTASGPLKTKSGKRKSRNEEEEEKFVDSKSSRRILKIGQELADEDEAETQAAKPNAAFNFESRFENEVEEDEPEFGEEDGEEWGDDDEVPELVELAPEDRDTFGKFFPENDEDDLDQKLKEVGWGGENDESREGQGTDLTALILERIAQFEAKQSAQPGVGHAAPNDDGFFVHPKVMEVYTKIGLILSRYKSGKLPKPFKILPTVPNWEDILVITRPDKWTPNACYEATRIFVSRTPIIAQRFVEMVLLEKVREDIFETNHLNVHLFKALKKALYKPASFFKGFLFPLIGSGTCTLREARIISGVLVRVSIPALLDKKYALPYQVIDALVFHFLRFRSVDPAGVRPEDIGSGMEGVTSSKDAKLPVIWHQCLFAFAQRYRNDITEDQRESLLDLINVKGHSQIGPEVRRELLAGRGRGVVVEEAGPAVDGDDTMMID